MGLLQLRNHVVQGSPYWKANDALGRVKESHQIWIFFQVSYDHRSCERILSNCVEKPEKVRTLTVCIWIFFVQRVSVRHLLSSMAIFVPRDFSAAKGSLLYEIPLLRIVPKPGSLVLICTISQCNNPFFNLLFPMFCSTERVPWLFHPTLLNSTRRNTKVIGLMVKWQVMAKWGELVGFLFACFFSIQHRNVCTQMHVIRCKINFDLHYRVQE